MIEMFTFKEYINKMITKVVVSQSAQKQLRKVPKHVVGKFMLWVDSVETSGLEEVRKVSGFHDEAIRGQSRGQRSIRLSRSYRAFYVIAKDGSLEFINVEEVNKHVY